MRHMDATDLIAALNEDLAHEYASVIQYRAFASMVRGPHRPALRPLFAGEIGDELAHAALLADAIVALGGEPTVAPAPVALVRSAEAMLWSALEAERAAVARYVERRRQAEALGEHGLAVALDDVIADEASHRDELRLVLDGWSPAESDGGRIAAEDARRRASRAAGSGERRAGDAPSAVPARERERAAVG